MTPAGALRLLSHVRTRRKEATKAAAYRTMTVNRAAHGVGGAGEFEHVSEP